jgi:hypothetical protein
MKRIFILCLLISVLQLVKAQQPEQIYSYGRVSKPISYYKEQAAAWRKVLDADPKNANAWYNYYYANRNLCYHDTTDQRPEKEKDAAINKLVDDMGKSIPNSYEYNLCKWMAGGFDMSLLPYLKKAAELGEGRTEHLDFMVNIGEVTRDANMKFKYEKMKYDAGLLSSGIMYYNYNVISGLALNAILITAGDNDTYPIWALQAMGIRRDITVLNLSMIHLDDYRSKIFKELGLEKWDIYWGSDGDSAKRSQSRFDDWIIKHITTNKKNYPVYVGLTVAGNGSYTDNVQENLYLTGLAYLYSKESVDNIALMKRNFEQLYALDYIENAFYKDLSPEMVKEINRNYIVPMLKLFDHYKISVDTQKEEWIKHKLMIISKDTEDEQEVKKYLDKK